MDTLWRIAHHLGGRSRESQDDRALPGVDLGLDVFRYKDDITRALTDASEIDDEGSGFFTTSGSYFREEVLDVASSSDLALTQLIDLGIHTTIPITALASNPDYVAATLGSRVLDREEVQYDDEDGAVVFLSDDYQELTALVNGTVEELFMEQRQQIGEALQQVASTPDSREVLGSAQTAIDTFYALYQQFDHVPDLKEMVTQQTLAYCENLKLQVGLALDDAATKVVRAVPNLLSGNVDAYKIAQTKYASLSHAYGAVLGPTSYITDVRDGLPLRLKNAAEATLDQYVTIFSSALATVEDAYKANAQDSTEVQRARSQAEAAGKSVMAALSYTEQHFGGLVNVQSYRQNVAWRVSHHKNVGLPEAHAAYRTFVEPTGLAPLPDITATSSRVALPEVTEQPPPM